MLLRHGTVATMYIENIAIPPIHTSPKPKNQNKPPRKIKHPKKANRKQKIKNTAIKKTAEDQQNRTINNIQPMGDPIGRKAETDIRIYTQNINGIKTDGMSNGLHNKLQVMTDRQVDIFGWLETNLKWQDYTSHKTTQTITKKHIPGGHWSPTTSPTAQISVSEANSDNRPRPSWRIPKHGTNRGPLKFIYVELQDANLEEADAPPSPRPHAPQNSHPTFINQPELNRISTLEHLNDAIINVSLHLITQNNAKYDTLNTHYMHTVHNQTNPDSLRHWHRKINQSPRKHWIIPIGKNKHWIHGIVNPDTQTIDVYNS